MNNYKLIIFPFPGQKYNKTNESNLLKNIFIFQWNCNFILMCRNKLYVL
jgi:hypothetical protein